MLTAGGTTDTIGGGPGDNSTHNGPENLSPWPGGSGGEGFDLGLTDLVGSSLTVR